MISEFKIHKSSMLYDNKTGVIFEKPYNEFAQAHLNSHNNKYLQALQDILSKSAIDGSVVELSPDAIEQYFKLNGFTELILKTTDECNLRCKYCVYSDHYPYTSNNKSWADIIHQLAKMWKKTFTSPVCENCGLSALCISCQRLHELYLKQSTEFPRAICFTQQSGKNKHRKEEEIHA